MEDMLSRESACISTFGGGCDTRAEGRVEASEDAGEDDREDELSLLEGAGDGGVDGVDGYMEWGGATVVTVDGRGRL